MVMNLNEDVHNPNTTKIQHAINASVPNNISAILPSIFTSKTNIPIIL